MQTPSPKKFFLYLLIASVSISAALGIAVILFGNFGDVESRILLTTFAITCTSILGLACGVSIEAKRGKVLPIAGICFSVTAAILWIIVIWAENSSNQTLGRLVMTTTLFAVAFSHLSLISLARLDHRYRWSLFGVFISVAGLVAIINGLIWKTETFESELTFRILGVLSIIAAALTIVIPVFHRLSISFDGVETIETEIAKLKGQIAELEKRKKTISNSS